MLLLLWIKKPVPQRSSKRKRVPTNFYTVKAGDGKSEKKVSVEGSKTTEKKSTDDDKGYEFGKIWIVNEQLPSDDSMSDYGSSGSESDISELSYDKDDYEDYVLWNEEDKMLRKDPYKYDLVHTYQNVFLRRKFVFFSLILSFSICSFVHFCMLVFIFKSLLSTW